MRPRCSCGRCKRPGLDRDEQTQVRCALAEAWLLQDDIRQATEALGATARGAGASRSGAAVRPLAAARPPRRRPRRAVARHRAFSPRRCKQAERAHDSRAIGLAHYELGLCYRQVGDTGDRPRAPDAGGLGAARRRRPSSPRDGALAVGRDARAGRPPRRGDGGARAGRAAGACSSKPATSLATVCGNQANVALMQHRHEQALALAERSVELQEQARHAARPRRRARLARADLRARSATSTARRRRSTARSTSAARCSSCGKRPARSSTRWRRST